MTKAELLDKLRAKVNDENCAKFRRNLSHADCEALLEALESVVLVALCDNDYVPLPGIGVLGTKKRNSRMGRNPQTGQPLVIPACVVPDFKPSAALKQAVKISHMK